MQGRSWLVLLIIIFGILIPLISCTDSTTISGTPSISKLEGVCYGPFRDGEDPNFGVLPTESELEADLDFIVDLANAIRIYSVTGSLQIIPDLCESRGINCYAGAWISGDKKQNDKEIQALIKTASRNYSHLKLLIIGNEVLLREDLTEDELIQYIQQVKNKTDLPVGTAEPWSVWLNNPRLAQSVDVILVHIHPYWEGINVNDAAKYVLSKWEQVKKAYPENEVIIGETGWPSQGDNNNEAIPGEENQREFFLKFGEIAEKNKIEHFYFELFDEKWKEKVEALGSGKDEIGNVGSHWGIFYSSGTVKSQLEDLIPSEAQKEITRLPRKLEVIRADVPCYVYYDYDSPKNHFFPTGWMGDLNDIALEEQCTEKKYSGESCVKISYSPLGSEGWSGIYWQYPINNWGDYPGYDISGANSILFVARGESGGEKAEFKSGGINVEGKPYSDSFGPVSSGVLELTKQWKEYKIDLKGEDLSMVIGGFCWVASKENNPGGCTIYIDDIRFEHKEIKPVAQLFYPSGWMGDWNDIKYDDGCETEPYSGETCIKISYSASRSKGKGWAGIYWQYPDNNWGDNPDGRDLTGTTKLTFWAKGQKGGEKAEFKVGGIEGKYPDSVRYTKSTNVIILSKEWKQYTINLKGEDLSHVVGGFCWVTNVDQNRSGCTIFLDDIFYE